MIITYVAYDFDVLPMVSGEMMTILHIYKTGQTMKGMFVEILVLILLAPSTRSCLFSHKVHKANIESRWNDADVTRKTIETCACGKFGPNGAKPWNVFLYIDKGETSTNCIGTVITSNLIATTHNCFLLDERKLNLYDILKPTEAERNAVWDVEKVTVSTSMEAGHGKTFQVEEIIYSPDFAIKSQTFPPEFDVAFIRVTADFTSSDSSVRPICIPRLKDVENLKMASLEAYYYGIVENISDISPAHLGSIKEIGNAECKETLGGKSFNDRHLCLRFVGGATTPVQTGGPLYLESSDSSTGFLVGIATVTNIFLGATGIDYHLFTNLIPLIKYIEWISQKHDSGWCNIPTKFEANKSPQKRAGDGSHQDLWPWEDPKIPATPRLEVLDCECGLVNSPRGRIVGGETAVPYEFGWMSYIMLYHEGKGRSANLCGGSIINDKMILTAAHCLANDKKIRNGDPPGILPENLVVYVQIHHRTGDELATQVKVKSVLFHPDFLIGRKDKGLYFDYDIGLLILEEPLTFAPGSSHGLRPVCLPKLGAPYQDVVGQTAVATGWGLTDPDIRSRVRDLQKVELPIAPLELCRSITTQKITDNNICAGTLNRFKDAAAGDSGGPLMVKWNNSFTEYGIVSWAKNEHVNGEIKTAALYSDVQRLLPFIDFHATRAKAKWCQK